MVRLCWSLGVILTGAFGWAATCGFAPERPGKPVLITKVPCIITEPGAYEFSSDLFYSENCGFAIRVRADNVTVDLKGHKLWTVACAKTTAVGIFAIGQSHVRISNGTIQGFQFGVQLEGMASSGNQVRSLLSAHNSYIGIWVDGAASVIANNRVEHTGGCAIAECTTPIAIHVCGADSIVADNQVEGFVRCPGITKEVVGVSAGEAPRLLVSGNVFMQPAHCKNSWAVWMNSPDDDFSTTARVEGNYFANFYCGCALAYARGQMKENTFYNVSKKWIVPESNINTDSGGNRVLPLDRTTSNSVAQSSKDKPPIAVRRPMAKYRAPSLRLATVQP